MTNQKASAILTLYGFSLVENSDRHYRRRLAPGQGVAVVARYSHSKWTFKRRRHGLIKRNFDVHLRTATPEEFIDGILAVTAFS